MARKKKIYKKKGKVIKDLTRNIFKILNEDSSKFYNYKQIAAKMGIADTDGKTQILKKLAELTATKKIKEIDRGKYQINEDRKYHIGILDVTSNGNAYFISDDFENDVFVPSVNLGKGLHNDTVRVYVYKKKRSNKLEADVVEILERAKKEFVGVLQMSKNFGFVLPDSNKMYADIFISQNKLNGAEHGDKVVAKITDWPENSKNPFGKITQVLGKPGDHDTEIHSILLEYGLPYEFPAEVEKEAATLPIEITAEEIAKRRDMRKDLTFTIDPKDAKDFDDALSFTKLENGNYEIGVHIADVSHYVQPKTILDDEAYSRATSVYLVDRVVPMLPEMLSNGVCSLRPHEEKLTFSAVFEMNEKAELVNQWFGRTVTYSDQRFAYEEAQAIIENCSLSEINKGYTMPIDISIIDKEYQVAPALVEATLKLDELAKKLRKKRMKEGAISFDRVEVKFNLDEAANPIGVYFKESKDANKLIEEFMLLANRKVAEFIGFSKGKATNKTFIYRIHDEPDIEKLASLQSIIGKFGYKIDTASKESTSESLNKLLHDVHGKGEANMVETLAIRSMSKAAYTTQNIGHYGLAFDYYSHFTSPIRRYPDVMTHRLLQHYLDGASSPKAEIYEEKCKHSSKMEELASKAERESIKYMQVKYMQDHKNEAFEGVISGVTEWGIYVEIKSNKCEGMVRIRDIKDDYYIFDEKQYAIVGQSTKNTIQLGDEVVVKVKHTDLERKHLDFELISH
ncbi:ribonuclease R [Tenacibaculum maritimum]|uniref:Ribonuclease R n=2 Tax=Tenacibaculum maritimum TaxID=107401 RepID=A0A2H1E618_9FLAO|nr:ribonuclease R [Tenacibaculum maritimum]MCD9580779.1 ribonuclease R [Tenacibaculum maritimum]MCD9635053.1 ribonuclease R [Tenacibaculum maritimum]QCD63460.1 ribonuclease R [Tenacibaculum maritimum]CAA0145077.1 Ribonuclease R [Tenacibaculum maritimum]CAA0145084.1 Ribonuclease R [Tenacibaculum maritimum]